MDLKNQILENQDKSKCPDCIEEKCPVENYLNAYGITDEERAELVENELKARDCIDGQLT